MDTVRSFLNPTALDTVLDTAPGMELDTVPGMVIAPRT